MLRLFLQLEAVKLGVDDSGSGGTGCKMHLFDMDVLDQMKARIGLVGENCCTLT